MKLDYNIEETVLTLLDDATPLETVITHAKSLTKQHFSGNNNSCENVMFWRMRLYAPIYVSSHCVNHCLYCGFRVPRTIDRRHLSVEDVVAESRYLLERGFKSQLIVAGESPNVSPAYLAEIMHRLRELQIVPSIEVAPMSVEGYAETIAAGCHGITLFQETFDRELYARYHPKGPKSDYEWRVRAIERAAMAGMPRLGYGVLLGLAEPKQELLAMIRHAAAVQMQYPDRILAFSLPRIHEGPDGFVIPHRVPDELFFRMYCVLRIVFPEADLVLSTRETPELRNRLAASCITQMSAESSTEPGGYALIQTKSEHVSPTTTNNSAVTDCGTSAPFQGQFLTTDNRSGTEVAHWLTQNGHQVIW